MENSFNMFFQLARGQVFSSAEQWKNYLRFWSSGNLYRYDFINSCMVYFQNPSARVLLDKAGWQKSGRQIKKGSNAIVILPVNILGMRDSYVFDIADTKGRKEPEIWQVDNLEELSNVLSANGAADLSDFTGTYVCDMINSTYNDEYKTLADKAAKDLLMEHLCMCVEYMTGWRCGDTETISRIDFGWITDYNAEDLSIAFGSLVSKISEDVLRYIGKEAIRIKEKERGTRDAGKLQTGRGRNKLSSDGRNKDSRTDEYRNVRKAGGEETGTGYEQIQLAFDERETGITAERSRGESIPDTGADRTEISAGKSTGESSGSAGDGLLEKPGKADSTRADSRNDKRSLNKADENEAREASFSLPNSGVKSRFRGNVEAIKVLHQLETEKRAADEYERAVLDGYVGWGGMSQAFSENNKRWENEYVELKQVMSAEEYTQARASVNNSFYTPEYICRCINETLVRFGMNEGMHIIDPAMGVGRFFSASALPSHIPRKNLHGIEIDEVSGKIARLLYPEADIRIKGFEEYIHNRKYDIAVGNVPFGDYTVYDRKYNKNNYKIHDYFFIKTLDLVKPGGVVAFITSKGTLDKKNSNVRKEIARQAELIGAVRLPRGTFGDTDVTSDILFFVRKDREDIIDPQWLYVSEDKNGVSVNNYYHENPDMLLGTMINDVKMFGEGSKYTALVQESSDFDLQTELSNALAKITHNLEIRNTDYQQEKPAVELEEIMQDTRMFTFKNINGQLYYRDFEMLHEVKAGKSIRERIKGLDHIRNIVREIIDLQNNGCSDTELTDQQKQLNEAYDSFVTKYGYINDTSNKRAFRDDDDYPLVSALEYTDSDKKVQKADIFSKRTIRPVQHQRKAESAADALHDCLNRYGRVDIPYMAEVSGRDENEIIQALQGQIYRDPEQVSNGEYSGWVTAEEYLSGTVRHKLRMAEIHGKKEPLYVQNAEALRKVQPDRLTAEEISVRLGTTWISTEDYRTFIYELLETPMYCRVTGNARWGIDLKFNPGDLSYFIEGKQMHSSVLTESVFGTSRISAYHLIEACLNLRTITIKDRIQENGKEKYVINNKETMLAREKAAKIKEEFHSWIFSDRDRRKKYEDYYNEHFNNVRLREYNGSYLQFEGMNPSVTLRDHQKNAIARILHGKNTLLAHCVGAGKTYEMIAGVMEMKRLNLINKAMFVVPNHLIEQFAGEFLRLYPSANVMATTKRDFSKDRRRQFVSRIATNNYDAVIIGHSQFGKIPVSAERRAELIQRQIDEVVEQIEVSKVSLGESWTVKQMEGKKKSLKAQLKKLENEEVKDQLINFEELGVDCLVVDEAHEFKNLAVFSKMNNVAGITSGGSQKAFDLYLKTQYINEINHNRGVIFATGTPLSNSMVELFVMQSYLQRDRLQETGMDQFDAWASTYGEVVTSLELTPEGSGFRFKNRFSRFTNLPELINLFKECADIVLAKDVSLPIPGLRTGKAQIVDSEPSPFVKNVMIQFAERARKIRDGVVDPSVDNMLKITHEAKLLGTDARILYPDAPDYPGSKVNSCLEMIMEEYRSSEAIKGVQIIFCDVSTPGKSAEFNMYDCLKNLMIQEGIPGEEICFIHEATTETKRETMFDDLRNGDKRIIIGSTPKMGTGTNIQNRLVALHHLDVPWRPSDIEQREGRILRQGNMNKEVSIYRYVTSGTFDAYSWGIIENKQKFISQVMTSDAVPREYTDHDETTLSYAEVKAAAIGDPRIKEKTEIDNDIIRLKTLKASHDNQKHRLEDKVHDQFPEAIRHSQSRIQAIGKDINVRDAMMEEMPEFEIELLKERYTDKEEAGEILLSCIKQLKAGEYKELGFYRGFTIGIDRGYTTLRLVIAGNEKYSCSAGESARGNISRLENLMNTFEEQLEREEKTLMKHEEDKKQAEHELGKPFDYEDEFRSKLERQRVLDLLLSDGNVKEDKRPDVLDRDDRAVQKIM